MGQKPITQCTQIRVQLCEQEKLIIEQFRASYLKQYKERLTAEECISEIILNYGELTKNK